MKFTTGEVLHLLINEIIKLKWLDNIGLELGRQEGLLYPLEEQLADSALEFRSNGLGLQADPHVGNFLCTIRLKSSSQQSTEGSLSSTVLTLSLSLAKVYQAFLGSVVYYHQHDDFGVGKVTRVDT